MSKLAKNREPFANRCKAVLEDATGVNNLKFFWSYSDLTYTLADHTYCHIKYDGRTIDAIELGKNLRLGFNISWHKSDRGANAQKMYLKGISIQFFHMDDMICKAEWDFEDKDDEKESIHPQPHWHFIKEDILVIPDPVQQGFMAQNQDVEQQQEPLRFGEEIQELPDPQIAAVERLDYLQVKRMHFVQVAKWLQNDMTNYSNIDYDDIKNWITCCVKSVKDQHDFHYESTQ